MLTGYLTPFSSTLLHNFSLYVHSCMSCNYTRFCLPLTRVLKNGPLIAAKVWSFNITQKKVQNCFCWRTTNLKFNNFKVQINKELETGETPWQTGWVRNCCQQYCVLATTLPHVLFIPKNFYSFQWALAKLRRASSCLFPLQLDGFSWNLIF
jgi:hypothetical protein